MNKVNRVFVEKKDGFDLESVAMQNDIADSLHINVGKVRIINRYDVEGISEKAYKKVAETILSEPNLDNVYYEEIPDLKNERIFAIEYLPGQYDQRADWASMCAEVVNEGNRPKINSSKVIIIENEISDEDFLRIKKYLINAVDSREASLEKPETLEVEYEIPETVETLEGFRELDDNDLHKFLEKHGLAMSDEDLKLIQEYFRDDEKRDPTITEIKVLDTYWSDHCRHTTFQTILNNINFEEGILVQPIKDTLKIYKDYRKELYDNNEKPITLMDIAVIAMKRLRKSGQLDNLDVSDEINACSIVVDVDIDGNLEKYLVMFKNETHNHPTEIEPLGGASTCLGGAIRDPLSGRSYVYQAMRITGSGDPREKIENTLEGKLPQRKITKEAAKGYSSYGNQIGLATGYVKEIYHSGYIAKRMEVGAVIGAAPYKNVVRKKSEPGDKIILLGGRTGRDGIGGASGSSKIHTEKSLESCNAEVQKGNPPTERKIQRLFRKKEVTTLIKKCNDFGAGGVSVAIGELADGLKINLDLVPKKYEGLDGTEIAISESQERMAVVVAEKDVDRFIKLAEEENLEAVVVAEVTEEKRIVMNFKGETILNISRKFLDTNGAKSFNDVEVMAPKENENYFKNYKFKKDNLEETLKVLLKDLNICCQRGLIENFDSSIGGNTVLMPFGGKYQLTPEEGMVCKIPLLKGETSTGTIMTCGFNPYISSWSPFHGALYAVIESVSKVVALGGDYKKIRLSLQEYFEKLGKDKKKWGKPFSALLGALCAEHNLEIPAIGGKDSMSGTFKELTVPPTLISFAVDTVDVNKVVSGAFKNCNSKVIVIKAKRDESEVINFNILKKNYNKIHSMIERGLVLSSYTVSCGGALEALSKMSFGNRIGFSFNNNLTLDQLVEPNYGNIILELSSSVDLEKELEEIEYDLLGHTIKEYKFIFKNENIDMLEMESKFIEPLEKVFPTDYLENDFKDFKIENFKREESYITSPLIKIPKPKVIIPVFPGTNCEYDCEIAFEKAGAKVETLVFNNLNSSFIEESIEKLKDSINSSQIIMLPGGFSAGDEPDGSGKFIATVFRNEKIKEAVMNLLKNRDGLILGICNGFQALIKLGLVTYGEIRDLQEDSPTLTHNKIGRHMSTMVNTKIVSNNSPWFSNVKVRDIHRIPISHGEGRFYADEKIIKKLFENNQVATQYVDFDGNPSYDIRFNPNGSAFAIEGITSPDGRVLGKMGHSERILGKNVIKNIEGNHNQKIFESGVNYFK